MIIGMKDIFKMIGIFIISYCAVFVCTLFLNFNIDIVAVKDLITSEPALQLYQAQVATGKVTSAVSGGCLLVTSVIMLFFYIKHYIDTHRKELGILKALGYSNWKIARGFWVFGLSIFLGTAIGYGTSHWLMPLFYKIQNDDGILPEYSVHFHPILGLYLVLIPTIIFALLSVMYSYYKLRTPVLELLRGKSIFKVKRTKKDTDLTFLDELRKNTVRQRWSLVFFIGFATFCFASMMQMSLSMDKLASVLFSVMIMLIGIVLAFVTLLIALTTVINASKKNIAMMRVFGYSYKECSRAILGGYRSVAYIGFLLGTVYQYVILKVMVTVVFKGVGDVPEYKFDYQGFGITLFVFAMVYELAMYYYSKRIEKISVKEIMLE